MELFKQNPLSSRDWWIAGLLFLTALAFRAPFILRGETLLHSDESIVGVMAQDIAAGQRFPVYFYGQAYMGAVEAYAMAGLLAVGIQPMIALRLAPALFFALLTAIQYLMLKRWFGRTGGLLGAAALILCSPMFMEWTIAPRGGYIEAMVWGSALLWAYGEWFAGGTGVAPVTSSRHKFLFGLLAGSGLWGSPIISLYLVPIAIHALLARRREKTPLLHLFDRFDLAALPILLLLVYLTLSSLFGVWVDEQGIHRLTAPGHLPWLLTGMKAFGLLVALGYFLLRSKSRLAEIRAFMPSAAPLVFGCLVGYLPAVLYVLQKRLTGGPLDDSLPLGLRPIWTVGPTLTFLVHGLPLLLGADPSGYLNLIQIGRELDLVPLAPRLSQLLTGLNWVVLAGLFGAAVALVVRRGLEIAHLLRQKPGPASPAALLALAFAGMIATYVSNGCAFDFHSIRYLVPLWSILPGLLAASLSFSGGAMSRAVSPEPISQASSPQHNKNSWRRLAGVCVAALLISWCAGQFALWLRLGRPHPLRPVAEALNASGCPMVIAEIMDSHCLSFLTRQKPPVAEFRPFWARLGHYRQTPEFASCRTYLIETRLRDWGPEWAKFGFPGLPPVDTVRTLRPALEKVLADHTRQLLRRTALTEDYELWELDQPLVNEPLKD